MTKKYDNTKPIVKSRTSKREHDLRLGSKQILKQLTKCRQIYVANNKEVLYCFQYGPMEPGILFERIRLELTLCCHGRD